MALFSIIIPTHNRPDFLERSVSSILEQTFQDWELIVVDDGSEPENKRFNTDFLAACDDDRINYCFQANAGPGAARKRGLEQALGRYFILLDDDDYFLPNHFKKVADWLSTNDFPDCVINTGLISEYPGDKRLKHQALGNLEKQDQLPAHWRSPRNLTAFVFPRVVIDLVPVYPIEQVIEDFGWLSRVLFHVQLVGLSDYTAVYVHHGENRNYALFDPDLLRGRLKIISSAYEYADTSARVPVKLKDRLLCHQCWHYARQCWGAGEWRMGINGFLRGFRFVGWGNVGELGYTVYLGIRSAFAAFVPR